MKNRRLWSVLLITAILLAALSSCGLLNMEPENNLPVIPIAPPTTSFPTLPDRVETTVAETEDGESSTESETTEIPSFDGLDLSSLPAYTGSPYAVINGNKPVFDEDELTVKAYETYSPLDALGRCGEALASCGREIMPAADEERGSISSVYPSGWVQAQYDCVSGKYLYNRSHLIGWQLSAENANNKNLITGTRYMNTEGMLPFENMVADYIRETGNHVAYRVTPVYNGNELVCRGVQIEAYSIEDEGEGICFNVYCYNVQPGVIIEYATGRSYADGTEPEAETVSESETVENGAVVTYVLNENSKKIHKPTCGSAASMSPANRREYTGTLASLLGSGYTTCGICFS